MARQEKNNTSETRTRLMRRLKAFLLTAFACIIGIAICSFPFTRWEANLYDLRFKFKKAQTDDRIKLIGLDDETLNKEGYDYSLPLDKITTIIDNLATANPLAVAILLPLKKGVTKRSQKRFIKSAKKLRHVIVGTPLTAAGLLKSPSLIAKEIPYAISNITLDRKSYARDMVTRRAFVRYRGLPVLGIELAQINSGPKPVTYYRGAHQYIKGLDIYQTYINYLGPKDTFSETSLWKIYENKFDKTEFQDKFVFIGISALKDTEDLVFSPYLKDTIITSKLEVHGHILSNFLNNNPVKALPNIFDYIITILLSLLTLFFATKASPVKGMIMLIVEIIFIFIIGITLFSFGKLWVGMVHPLMAIFINYYFFIPYRLIEEYKKRWEYQQRNQILQQVEQLKTNFMSLMSHDLKTPVARIQGMSEMALRAPAHSSSAKEIFQKILKSAEELGVMISNILDLTRIESKRIKLNKTSKDLNTLIQECINKANDLAYSKRIKIVPKLEPMFSIKMDANLIRQVLLNLIENAIKYSPDNTEIEVSSKEIDHNVEVSIVDQGPGIANDEIDNIFSKFYRCKSHSTVAKGSGLGLYLVKYFVELHKGSINVKSEVGKGSAFSFQLPLNA